MKKYCFSFFTILVILFMGIPNGNAQESWPKIYDSTHHKWVDFHAVEQAMKESKIVFVGEIHNHAWGHQIEFTLLEKFFALHPNIAIAFEMFERDVQAIMDGYIRSEVTEEFFVRHSRPWGNYQSDYRPMVEFARSYRLPVLAMNVPRRYASYVSKGKEDVLWLMPDMERSFMAEKILALEGKYKEKFYKTMEGHAPPQTIERYYRAQCLKDDTMAMSIVAFLQVHPEAFVISYTGAFHSDEHLGLVEKVAMQIPEFKRLVVSIVPISGTSIPNPEEYAHRGNFLFFAPSEEKEDSQTETLAKTEILEKE